MPNSAIPKWSVFAGAGISTKLCFAMATVFSMRFGVDIKFKDSLYYELNT